MIRRPFIALLFALLACLGLAGCGGSLHSQQPPAKWSTGFWYWQSATPGAGWSANPLDDLYVQVGTLSGGEGPHGDSWSLWADLPDALPPAREYWLVVRFDRQAVPDISAAAPIAAKLSQLRAVARDRQWNVAGVQLDIDSPTRLLSDYSKFLAEVRKDLPSGMALSITALLDWFRPGTSIREVIRQVDEFVPQFYDLSASSSQEVIAAKVDAAKWSAVFNSYGKRFRIGVSSFGRAMPAPSLPPLQGGVLGIAGFFADSVPLDLAANPAFAVQTSRNAANELVLTYRAKKKVRVGYNDFLPGDGMQFILPTAETIRAAVASAKQMGGNCAGVVFFRWPSDNETLVMTPDEVLAAAGVPIATSKQPDGIQTVDGSCAAVKCADVYLLLANPLQANPVRYRIHSSAELEYFLPEQQTPIRMTGASEFELSLPAYGGRHRMLLGRAVSISHADFTVEEQR